MCSSRICAIEFPGDKLIEFAMWGICDCSVYNQYD